MAKVSLTINGRKYALGCEEGEEERLHRLGEKLDARVAQMANQFGQIGDLRLLVMAGITMLDELEDVSQSVEDQVETRLGEVRSQSEAAVRAAEKQESKATDSLLDAAMRIEKLAERLSDKTQD